MSKNESGLQPLPGERGMPSVNSAGPTKIQRSIIVLAMLLIVLMAAAAIYLKHRQQAAREAVATEKKEMKESSAVPARTFTDPPALPGSDSASAPASMASMPMPQQPPSLPGRVAATTPPPPELDKSASSIIAVKNDTGSIGAPGSLAGDAPPTPASGTGTGTNSNGGAGRNGSGLFGGGDEGSNTLGAMLTATRTPAQSAGMLGDRNYILAKGSLVDCVLQTRLDTTVPGMTACTVTRNIYSDNGKVLLIDRGSMITGEYQSNMNQGMARIFVLWTRIKTPNGVVINLDSPGADPLGGSGLPGYIDTHFWQRFGGALMLSLVDDVTNYALQSSANNNGNQVYLSNTASTTQNMAAEALKNTINIPPTLYKNQGEQIGIYIARDLNFSNVYKVAFDDDSTDRNQ